MYDKFEALIEDKRRTIIKASMKEFVKGGYDKASMNDLVEEAGISKGSLFYYFGNKKKLYLYLFEYCETLIIDNAHKHLKGHESDFLSRMEYVVRCNVNLLSEFPLVYAFVRSCKTERSPLVARDIERIKAESTEELFASVYKNIDESLFIENIDIKMAMYSIKSTMFQLIHDAMRDDISDGDKVLSEIKSCADFFRTAVYK